MENLLVLAEFRIFRNLIIKLLEQNKAQGKTRDGILENKICHFTKCKPAISTGFNNSCFIFKKNMFVEYLYLFVSE